MLPLNNFVISYLLNRGIRWCQQFHTGSHFTRAIFRHMSTVTVQKMADPLPRLPQYTADLGCSLRDHDPHSCPHKLREQTSRDVQMPREVGSGNRGADLHCFSGSDAAGDSTDCDVRGVRDRHAHAV